MAPFFKTLSAIAASALLAVTLFACSSGNASSSQTSADASSAQSAEREVSRADAEQILTAARAIDYKTMTFEVVAESQATAVINGETKQDTSTTSMKGELDKSGEAPKMHFAYESATGVGVDKKAYDMYLDSDKLIVNQKGEIFVNQMTSEMLNGYVNAVITVQSEADIAKVLDTASSFKVSEQDGETTVSVTSDAAKLKGSDFVDMSSLPEGTALATMVTSYTIGSDGRFKTVRAMVSTSGSPTYHITQTYRFSGYDDTKLPEWPDLSVYETANPDIRTDASGRQYIVGEDGTVYYIDSIGEDGTIYYSAPAPTGGENEDMSWLNDESIVFSLADLMALNEMMQSGSQAPTGDQAQQQPQQSQQAAAPEETTETVTQEFIEVNGKKYFLDEPGSSLEDVGNGYFAFYPSDGSGPYFIQY